VSSNDDFRPINESPISLCQSARVAANQYVEVYMDDVVFAGGQAGTHVRIREPNAGAVVLVMNEQDQLYLHRAYHYAVNEFCLETIRGYGEDGESAQTTALRELSEEAGFQVRLVGAPEQLGVIYPNSTILMTRVAAFLVRVRTARPATPRDRNEGLRDGRWWTLDEVETAVAGGEIRDGFTLSALALLKAKRGPRTPPTLRSGDA
jgi:8-oxo-dGTP pyrophosphatase MutT (NUDIX family)